MANLTLKLHKTQNEIFSDRSRYKIICSGRRFGKTYYQITRAIVGSLSYTLPIDPLSPPVILITMPTLKMARQIYFRPLIELLDGKPGFSIDRGDFRISVKHRPDILIRGFNDSGGDALRGLKIAGLIGDEVQDFKSIGSMDATVFPAMADTKGSWASLTGTPKGKGVNPLYKLYERCSDRNDWKFFRKFTSDNPFIPRSEIVNARRTLSDRLFKQEFEADFLAFAGQIATEANKDRHFAPLSKTEGETFYIGMDPGVVNPAFALFSIDSDRRFKVYKTFYKTDGQVYTSNDLLKIAGELAGGVAVKRIFIPDDRQDLVRTFREGGLAQAVLVKRHKPSPIERGEIMNSLFKCDRLLIDSSEVEFWDEVLSYHRDEDAMGNIVDAIAPNQMDHRLDGLLYGIGRLCIDYPSLLPHSILIKPNFNDDED